MMNLILQILSCLVLVLVEIYIWCRLLKRKIDWKSYRIYITILISVCSTFLNYTYNSQFLRVLVIILIYVAIVGFQFQGEKINKILITPIMTEFILIISEFILTIILLFVFDSDKLFDMLNSAIIPNFIVAGLSFIVVQFSFIYKIQGYLVRKTENLGKKILILFSFIVVITINVMLSTAYFSIPKENMVIINTLIMIVYAVIVVKIIDTKDQYIDINNKYNATTTSLMEYENILDKYRILNHENKNTLLTIRSMIVKKEKNIPEYIDAIIDSKIQDNEKLMFETNIIPAGGLRAIIYAKMSTMQEKNIDVKLKVDRKVRTVDLIELGERNVLDICKIVGVFLDNAIEAVENIENNHVSIELYAVDNILYIDVGNTYQGILEIEKFASVGYTTKENGHGYGLSLVKEIVSNNSKLSNEKMVSKDYFKQTLQVKLK